MHDFGSFTYAAAADHERRRDVGIAEMTNVWDNQLIRGRCLRFASTLAPFHMRAGAVEAERRDLRQTEGALR